MFVFFWGGVGHSSKIPFIKIGSIPFIKCNQINKIQLKYLGFFKENFTSLIIFPLLVSVAIMLSWRYHNFEAMLKNKNNIREKLKSVWLWNFEHGLMSSSGLFFSYPFYQSTYVMPKLVGKMWCIFIFWDDPTVNQTKEILGIK